MRDVTLNDIPDHEEGKYLVLVDYYNETFCSSYWEKDDRGLDYVLMMNYTIEEFRYIKCSDIKRIWLLNDEDGMVY